MTHANQLPPELLVLIFSLGGVAQTQHLMSPSSQTNIAVNFALSGPGVRLFRERRSFDRGPRFAEPAQVFKSSYH